MTSAAQPGGTWIEITKIPDGKATKRSSSRSRHKDNVSIAYTYGRLIAVAKISANRQAQQHDRVQNVGDIHLRRRAMKLPGRMLACVLAATSVSYALADDVRFAYQLHELDTPAKLEALLERIQRTAWQACRTEPVLPPHYRGARAACEKDLITKIVSAIDDSRLYVAAQQKPNLEIPGPDADRFAAVQREDSTHAHHRLTPRDGP
jgi:UrcA family protein